MAHLAVVRAVNDDGEGMRRVVRGRKKVYPLHPKTLAEVEPGNVALIAVRVGSHNGPPSPDTLCRCWSEEESDMYKCGDLVVRRSDQVKVWELEP